MSTITTRPINGVSFGYVHTVTATDATDNEVIIDFQVDYDLAAVVMVTTSDAQGDEIQDIGDAKIDYPAKGQVRVRDGDSSFTITEGDKIHVIANKDSNGISFKTGWN